MADDGPDSKEQVLAAQAVETDSGEASEQLRATDVAVPSSPLSATPTTQPTDGAVTNESAVSVNSAVIRNLDVAEDYGDSSGVALAREASGIRASDTQASESPFFVASTSESSISVGLGPGNGVKASDANHGGVDFGDTSLGAGNLHVPPEHQEQAGSSISDFGVETAVPSRNLNDETNAGKILLAKGDGKLSPLGGVTQYYIPSDPGFFRQWYLDRDAQDGVGGWYNDIDVADVWDDYTGKGVTVGIIDDGIEYTHYDLDGNYNSAIDWDAVNHDDNPEPVYSDDNHGTAVAGIIAAENNGIGSVGVAFDATITGYRVHFSSQNIIEQLAEQVARQIDVDISNNSWGAPYFFADAGSPDWTEFFDNLEYVAKNGREGLGTIFVFAAGNYGFYNDSANFSNLANSRYTIAVSAPGSYANDGANVHVIAPSPEGGLISSTAGIYTTDRLGDAGYEDISSITDGDYYPYFGGTSAAAPMVSGVVALMLEANPNLGARDVQEILVYSAHRNAVYSDPTSNGGSHWNGGGLIIDDKAVPLGLLDARAAVRLAETWSGTPRTFSNETIVSGTSDISLGINDFQTTTSFIYIAEGIEIDQVEISISGAHDEFNDLIIDVVSPHGTVSRLAHLPYSYYSQSGEFSWTFSSTEFWGEDSAGIWQLRIKDQAQYDDGYLDGWTIRAFGDPVNDDDVYYFTDDYAFIRSNTPLFSGRDIITDTNGNDTINASALVSTPLILDLSGNTPSSISFVPLQIASGTVIENIYGGDRDDILSGNSVDNLIHGGRGDDTLSGNEGNDTLDGHYGNDVLDGGDGDDFLIGGRGDDMIDGGVGNDAAQYDGTPDDYRILDLGAGDYSIFDLAHGFGNDTLSGIERLSFTGNESQPQQSHGIADIVDFSGWLGTSGDDILSGSSGANYLESYAGNDTLTGLDGDDILIAGDGDDTLDGGSGVDIAIVKGTSRQYALSENSGSFELSDLTANGGTDSLVDIEAIRFDDVLYTIGTDNIAPFVSDIVIEVAPGASVLASLAPFARDFEGESLAFAVGRTTDNGTLSIDSDGSFSYRPNAGFAGTDSFEILVSDFSGASTTATVEIDVHAGTYLPIAESDFQTGRFKAHFDDRSMLALPNGNYVVTWNAYYSPTYQQHQVFDSNGAPVSGVRQSPDNWLYDHLIPREDGGYTWTWTVYQNGYFQHRGAQDYDESGQSVGSVYSISVEKDYASEVAYSDGTYIRFLGIEDGAQNKNIKYSIIDSGYEQVGNDIMLDTGSPYTVKSYNENDANGLNYPLIYLENGNVLLKYAQLNSPSDGEYLRIFDAQGNPLTDPFESAPSIAGGIFRNYEALSNGGFVAAWSERHGDDIYFTIYDADGNSVAKDLAANVVPSPDDLRLFNLHAVEEGGFLLSWTVGSSNATETLFIREFDASGTPLFDPVAIDSSPNLTGGSHNFVTLANGDIAIAWNAIDSVTSYSRLKTTFLHRSFDDVPSELSGTDKSDILVGNGANNVITGGGGDDSLYGGGGNDALNGGTGSDRLDGGDGIDTAQYIGAAADFTIVRLANGNIQVVDHVNGQGVDTLAGIEFIAFQGDATTLAVGDLPQTFEGTPGNDSLTGTANNDILVGYDGDDTLIGGGGNDRLIGGDGFNVLYGGAGIDTAVFSGSLSDYTLTRSPDYTEYELTPNAGGPNATSFLEIERIEFLGDGATYALADIPFYFQGSSSDDVGRGGNANDIMYGYDGNDTLIGGAGADQLFGGDGIDTARYVDAPGAVIAHLDYVPPSPGGPNQIIFSTPDGNPSGNRGDAHGDTYDSIENLIGSNYDDWLRGDGNDNRFTGGAGNDLIYSNGGTDTAVYAGTITDYTISFSQGAISGPTSDITIIDNVNGQGTDRLLLITWLHFTGNGMTFSVDALPQFFHATSGTEPFNGGNGIDTVSYAASSAAITANLSEPSNNTGDAAGDSYTSIENLTGSAFDDRLTGDAGDNRLDGGAGKDVLDGGLGNDTLVGGLGVDTVLLTGAREHFVFARVAPGIVTVTDAGGNPAGPQGTKTLAGVEAVQFSEGGLPRMLLSHLVDAANMMAGDGTSENQLAGGAQDDNVMGGAMADRMHGGDGSDSMHGDDGDDEMDGGTGDDALWGGAGVDRLTGAGGLDYLHGGAGDDYLDGGSGDDMLLGGAGNDTIDASSGSDWLDGGDGDDLLRAGSGDDTLLGGAGDDILIAASGDDTLDGGAGDDDLFGGAGNDILAGGAGADWLYGDSGDDTFVFAGGDGDDTIADFAAGAGSEDVADVSDFGYADFTALLADIAQIGDDAVLQAGSGDSLTFAGVDSTALHQDDFLL